MPGPAVGFGVGRSAGHGRDGTPLVGWCVAVDGGPGQRVANSTWESCMVMEALPPRRELKSRTRSSLELNRRGPKTGTWPPSIADCEDEGISECVAEERARRCRYTRATLCPRRRAAQRVSGRAQVRCFSPRLLVRGARADSRPSLSMETARLVLGAEAAYNSPGTSAARLLTPGPGPGGGTVARPAPSSRDGSPSRTAYKTTATGIGDETAEREEQGIRARPVQPVHVVHHHTATGCLLSSRRPAG